ncbi:hypothetical protein HYX02_04325 [Candidatus Woesearchaeota archaeon]|nr:hypothetical protein [Candidatus Woesearchaeota archaeon]
MVNKAQVSLFFIFGVIILIAVGFINYLSSEKAKSGAIKETEIAVTSSELSLKAQIQSNVDFCVEGIIKEALSYTGLHGGYYNIPEPKIVNDLDEMPMYAYLNQNTTPSITIIESQISDYIKETLPDCVDGLDFENTKLKGEINSVTTTIGKDNVFVRVNYPLTLERTGTSIQVSDFGAEIPLRIDAIYGIALELTKNQLDNEGTLCVDCVIDLAEKNNLGIDVDLEERNLIFTIFDNAVTIDGNPYVFSFATE